MRTIDPRIVRRQQSRRHQTSIITKSLLAVFVVSSIAGGAMWWTHRSDNAQHITSATQSVPQVAGVKTELAPKTKPKIFTANQFRDLYRTTLPTYPNTEEFIAPPYVLEDATADAHIRAIAESRGFQLTRMPVTGLVRLNEKMVSGEKDDLLQPAAYKAWHDLKDAAKADGIPLALLSAYRSPEFQRDLFTSRLYAKGTSRSQVVALNADAAIQQTLGVTAVPGYSRHHTGYTVDFWCEDGSSQFAASSCFTWLKHENYLHAKEAGWIPSYPEGADEQGPEPEPWEYVWVGRGSVFE